MSKAILAGLILTAALVGVYAIPDAAAAAFVKYDGIDGESTDKDHKKWIDVLSTDWGASKESCSSVRCVTTPSDFVVAFSFDKASPRLTQAIATGEVIPKVDVHLTKKFPGKSEACQRADAVVSDSGKNRKCEAPYLKYEMKNVIITSFQTSSSDPDSVPTVVVGNNFEEIKITYTEYDKKGNSKGNVEYEWKVEKGE